MDATFRRILGTVLFLGLLILLEGGRSVFAEPYPMDHIIPGPEECTIAPRSVDQLLAFSAEAEAPLTPTAEEPPPLTIAPDAASDADIAGVQATIRGIVACTNAGDQRRIFAYYTDEILRTRVYVDPETLENPTPLPEGGQMAILGIPYVVPLEDGRVGAVVAFDHPAAPSPVQAFFWVFAKSGDRWLFDAWPDPFITTFESSVEIID